MPNSSQRNQLPLTTQPLEPAPPPQRATLARSFDAVAAQYAAARPGYPPALFDAIEELAGQPLAGARVLDVGAGTGIATRLLAERGARVTAVEPGAAMAAELHAAHPAVPLVRALGDALPFRDDAGFDLVGYAQAWHWTDPARSVPEALRVLRPGGALALWWNIPDPDVAWAAEQEARIARRLPGYHGHSVAPETPDLIRGLGLGLHPVARVLHWTRRVPVDTHLAMLGSRSYFSAIGPAAAPVLAAEREALRDVFPDGIVEEAYALDLTVTLRPSTSS
ncbi:class I SAM-dependent methyltransferase [Streptomyces sp. RPA4-5]|uniref:class I SAM-dependent methyltransferase n=1 Tax=Streptomyces TaxID=1883 RepID=UPI00143E9936|nr:MULTISPECIES: class I SAM-dependent methyltransferase [Streptomyces]MCX4639550.1 class I SAM-dependent methyltransferase [Streptomyces platensis]QIY56954.1 class I SAM-dependent methyltransferase [Streptomyces sp. RPA4-5]WJY39916.1 class I SAM-dependent methyltransferase [Streptomyces sp. P9-2B-2]